MKNSATKVTLHPASGGVQNFTLTIDAEDINVRYLPNHIQGVDPYALLEFRSPHEPRRPIPVSEKGYRSYFAPMREIESAPSVEEFAWMVVLVLARETARVPLLSIRSR